MRLDKNVAVGNGYLKFKDFRSFVKKNSFITTIELSNNGEIFLNPELLNIIKYAHENGIELFAKNGVNFNMVSDEMLEALVKYRFKFLSISIDGASQEIYVKYRQNGDFDTVISNIHKLIEYKQKHDSEFPAIRWQYILMRHNECEVIKAKTLAKKLNVSMKFKRTWEKGYIPNDPEMLKRETGLKYLSVEEFAESESQEYSTSTCYQLWDLPAINWDGRLLGCCRLYTDDFGVNVFEVGLEKALNSKRICDAKKILCGGKVPSDCDTPCLYCKKYALMVKNNNFIKK